jgi:hypothetical protein
MALENCAQAYGKRCLPPSDSMRCSRVLSIADFMADDSSSCQGWRAARPAYPLAAEFAWYARMRPAHNFLTGAIKFHKN